MKIIKKSIRIIPLITLILFLLLGTFNTITGIALHMESSGATFNLDNADPVGYGVYIPAPNMYTTMSVGGSNQGQFVRMDWDGTSLYTMTVNQPGDDISNLYPQYFNYVTDSTTDNDYIDPWSVEWLNVSAYNAESDTLSPFTLNSAFNYYVMAEGSDFLAPINNSVPMQIDIMIDTAGPKILKFDWLTDNPAAVSFSFKLISPSGKLMNINFQTAQHSLFGPVNLFDYIAFVANSAGTYRLLVSAAHNMPGHLNLEFLPTNIFTLPLEKLTFLANSEEIPNGQDMWDIDWQSNWFKISGKKGDLYRLDLGVDYYSIAPYINAWEPCENGYSLTPIGPGIYELYFPKSGNAYISFNDGQYGMYYRFSLFLNEIEALDYNIGDPLTEIGVSFHERKTLEFSIAQDSFVRFNFTEWGTGNAQVNSDGTVNGFIFKDAKNLDCYEVFDPIETKAAGSMTFYYYYFPAGDYVALIKNSNPASDSVLQISSKYAYSANATVPITTLSYPLTNPTTSITAQFEPDEYYSSLKQGQWLDINIPETGQYRFNWSILASDNLAQTPTTVNPSYVLLYNDTAGEYYDYTTTSHTFLQSFDSLENVGDYLYMAYPSKWHDIELNFTTGGVGGSIDLQINRPGSGGFVDKMHTDNTGELNNNDSLIITMGTGWWLDWVKGVDGEFDIETIDEDDYYWVRLECSSGYSIIPEIDLITLSNVTIHGDVNFALVRESGYEYCDVWELTAPSSSTDIIINQESTYYSELNEEWLFGATSNPHILGLEEGNYKLLVVPEQWSHSGPLTIRFAIENYWGYNIERSFTVDQTPVAHSWQIRNMVNVGGSTLYNYSTYPYDFTVNYNGTMATYVAVNCQGTPFSWTQLVVGGYNITFYNLYILQDLPWIDNNGPFQEIMTIAGVASDNNTVEFGVINANFTLLFEIFPDTPPNEMVTLNIGIRQYNTTKLYGDEISARSTPPPPDLGLLFTILWISIPSAVGVVAVVYIVRKRGIKVKKP